MLTRDALIASLTTLRRATIAGQRAPYKPLTLLWALGRMSQEGMPDRLISFTQARDETSPLFGVFGRGGDHQVNPINPLWRLQNDCDGLLWECSTTAPAILTAEGIPSATELTRLSAKFGLSAAAFDLLKSDAELRIQSAHLLAAQVCPPDIWEDLFEAVRLPFDASADHLSFPISSSRTREVAHRVRRDPRFRAIVLDVYDGRCAICGTRPKVADRPFGIEAAHIRWVTENGPDEIRNGLALCVMHHRGLDRGAFTLTDAMKVEVSPYLERPNGSEVDNFWGFAGADIALPARTTHQPLREFVDWHRREVFRSTWKGESVLQ